MKFKLPIASALCLAALTSTAHAEYKVRSPNVESGELGLETVGNIGSDRNPTKNNAKSMVVELEYGVNEWWKTEIEGEWGRDGGAGNAEKFIATTWGNQFQLFPQGSKWLDMALWAEYSTASKTTDADKIKFGPLAQKSIGKFTTTANFYLEKQIGANATGGSDATYAAQVKYDWKRWIDPAIEVYGDLGYLNQTTVPKDQTHMAGPALVGQIGLGKAGELKYEIGYLAGLTTATAESTVRWKLEYEIAF